METPQIKEVRLSFIITWKHISNINNKGETTCRNIIKDLRSKYGSYYITEDHICEYFMISREQYIRCQEQNNWARKVELFSHQE